MAAAMSSTPTENALLGQQFRKTEFIGVSKCYGCGRWSVYPELMFCHGSGHQFRRSQCARNFVIDRHGNRFTEGLQHTDATVEAAKQVLAEVKNAFLTTQVQTAAQTTTANTRHTGL